MKVPGLLVSIALVLGACGTEPSAVGFSGQYLLAIDASDACPRSGSGGVPVRHFEWVVLARSGAQGPATFSLPPLPDPNLLDGLELSLETSGDAVSGSLQGGARLDRTVPAGYTVSFRDSSGRAASLAGRVERDGAGRVTSARGALAGTVNVGLYFSSAGGVCPATDHAWSMTGR
jgi:hypothetical protein